MPPEPAAGTAPERQLLRWYAALVNADAAPARFVALGDSLLYGALHPAVERLSRHYNPVRLQKAATGMGWIPAVALEGDGRIADEGGFDGAPRLLNDGEECSFQAVMSSVDIHGEGTVEAYLNGREAGTLTLSGATPCTLVVAEHVTWFTTVMLRARGEVSLHGAATATGNERRGVRFRDVLNPGKTFRFYLERTDALSYLSVIQPDLLLLCLGTNDVSHHGVASFEADFAAFMGRVRDELPRTSICYWFPHRARLFSPEQWDAARDAAERVCSTYGVTLIDGYARMGSTATEDDTERITSDGVHYTRSGKVLFSEAVLATIAPGLHMAPDVMTSTPLQTGQFYVGRGDGDILTVGPPPTDFSVFQSCAPNSFAPAGLFFSKALYMSEAEPVLPPPPDSAALFLREGPDGLPQLCLHLPDGSVRAVALQDPDAEG